MRVTIVDLDWYNHKSFLPNPKCMKISSYYKQKHALINFAVDEYHLKMDFDEMYVVREKILSGEFPAVIDLLDSRVHLIGEGLKFYSRYMPDIDDVMAACRPDYRLYPLREENKMANADIVQFFADGKLLPRIQDYHNTYGKAHYTYVTDKGFWTYDEPSIKKCCEKLKKDKYIIFADGIDLDLILSSKNKIKMIKKLNIDWREEKVSVTLDTDKKIKRFLDFVDTVPESYRPAMNLVSPIVFSGDHFQKNSICLIDFHRYFRLIGQLKKKKIHVIFKAPPRLTSPFWFYFEDLEGWTTYRPYSSFIEYMTEFCCEDHQTTTENLLANPLQWSQDSVHRLMDLWRNYPEIMEETGYIQWNDKKLDTVDMKDIVRGKRIREEKII